MNFAAARILVALAVVAGAWFHGHHVGATAEKADCQARELATVAAAEAQAETNRLSARSASARYVVTAQRIRARLEPARIGLRQALQAPVNCRLGASNADSLKLADVTVPAAALDRLRDAAGQGTGND